MALARPSSPTDSAVNGEVQTQALLSLGINNISDVLDGLSQEPNPMAKIQQGLVIMRREIERYEQIKAEAQKEE